MKAIMVMYDSLCRKLLKPYGCDWTITPNFTRVAAHCVQFENNYVGSLPCMPARRELHTGRFNFLHRSWGPIEPFDDSMPEILKKNGIYTHLVSDHQHYWEDGGATYHNRYSSWEISRGQEGDLWKADLHIKWNKQTVFENKKPQLQYPLFKDWYAHDERNRQYMNKEERTSQAYTFQLGLDFIHQNHDLDNWFLTIETFDPHEPFFSLDHDKAKYPHDYSKPAKDLDDDWPPYAKATEDASTIEHVRCNYAALITKCDRYLGKVLDLMDQYNLWKDTMLIINTDHGLLLGEHGWWGKTTMPIYEEIAHTPLWIYDPRLPELAGIHRYAITQNVDLAPTLLEYFHVPIPADMQGKPLKDVMLKDHKIRSYAVFGYHGSQIDITDGRYTYMLTAAHPEIDVYDYTLMPTHMRALFSVEELQSATLAGPFSFTKGCQVLKIKTKNRMGDTTSFGTKLYDLTSDPDENTAIQDKKIEKQMQEAIYSFMQENEAPAELYERFGFNYEGN